MSTAFDISGYNSILKLAVVTDIILDENHPYFDKKYNNRFASELKTVLPDQLPINYKLEEADKNDIDYSYIGRAKVRILNSDKKLEDFKLKWAIPLHTCITQYPLLNETVLVIQIGENLYYTNAFNYYNLSGVNASYLFESGMNLYSNSAIPSIYKVKDLENDAKELNTILHKKSYLAPPNVTSVYHSGYLGERFILNPFIRTLKRNEGDTVIESRFGQSIRFSAYDNTSIDQDISEGSKKQRKDSSYQMPSVLSDSTDGGFGNPVITIRNRQRNISKDGVQEGLHPKLNKIQSVEENKTEKNYGGQIEEDINNDGSTIELSSGLRKTKWIPTTYKSIFGTMEEQSLFQGETSFEYPDLDGDQIVINSDRIILSSRLAETFHYSKKRYSVITDNEYTVDANDQIVLTTNNATTINSPQIFLGQWGETGEPAVLGQTMVNWLYELCNWLLEHTHWYHHIHPDTGDSKPPKTQIPVQILKLQALRDQLHKLLSRRVYITGGGFAPGADGVKPKTLTNNTNEVKDPLKINVTSGAGAIGGFNGSNYRK